MDFKTAVRYVNQARCTEPTRQNIGNFLARDGCLCATDGHRMHIAVVSDGYGFQEPTVLTPERVNAMLIGEPYDCSAQPSAEDYPDILRVIESLTANSTEVVVEAEAIRAALAELFQKATKPKGLVKTVEASMGRRKQKVREPKPCVLLNFLKADQKLVLSNRDEKRVEVMATGIENDVEMGMDPKYLRQALSGMDGYVTIGLSGELTPLDIQGDERRAVVMPMRV